MITKEEPRIILEGITVDEFLSRLELQNERSVPLPPVDETMTVEEAAKFLKLSVPTIHRLKAANKIPFKKVGARVLYLRTELTNWLKEK